LYLGHLLITAYAHIVGQYIHLMTA